MGDPFSEHGHGAAEGEAHKAASEAAKGEH
jgi:hypothetical protein